MICGRQRNKSQVTVSTHLGYVCTLGINQAARLPYGSRVMNFLDLDLRRVHTMFVRDLPTGPNNTCIRTYRVHIRILCAFENVRAYIEGR